jgi:hypothetical protein
MKEAILSLVFLHLLIYGYNFVENNIKILKVKEFSILKKLVILVAYTCAFSLWQIKDFVKSIYFIN